MYLNMDFSYIIDIEGMCFINEEDVLNKLINEIYMRYIDLKDFIMFVLSFNVLYLVYVLA